MYKIKYSYKLNEKYKGYKYYEGSIYTDASPEDCVEAVKYLAEMHISRRAIPSNLTIQDLKIKEVKYIHATLITKKEIEKWKKER